MYEIKLFPCNRSRVPHVVMFLVHCAYLNFPAFLLAIWRGKWVKRDESKNIWVFTDGHLDEPQELEKSC